MPKDQETGATRQERIQREQHRPEQNAGYDEAVHGGALTANSIEHTVNVPPMPPDEQRLADMEDADEREARRAAADVRRQDRSAR